MSSESTTTLRATYRQRGERWEGVVKDDGGAVLFACGHSHRNRDAGREDYGGSARGCAKRWIADYAMGRDRRGFIDGRAHRLPNGRVAVVAEESRR